MASNITQQCKSACPNNTYAENGTCKAQCEYGYANDASGTCASGCPSDLFADPVTHDCVAICQDHQTDVVQDYFRDLSTGFCVDDCSPLFKDFLTGDCVEKWSPGYWGYTGNHTCNIECVAGEYGLEDADQRTCFTPANLPSSASSLFGDPVSGEYVAVCATAPQLYFGDKNLHECVTVW